MKELQFFGFKYISTSKKAIIYSSIGLIVILTLIVSSLFYTTAQFDTQLQNDVKAFQNSDSNTYTRGGTFHYDLGIGSTFIVHENNSIFKNNFNSIKDSMLSRYELFANQRGLTPYLSSIQVFVWDENLFGFYVNNSFIHDTFFNSSTLSSSAIKPFIILETNQYLLNILSQLGYSINFNSTNAAVYLQLEQNQLINPNSISLYNYISNSTYNITKTYQITKNIKLDPKYFPFSNHNFYNILLVQNISNLYNLNSNQELSYVINPVFLSKVKEMNFDQFLAFNSKVEGESFKNAFLQIGKNILGSALPPLYQPDYYNEINDLNVQFQNDISSQNNFLLVVIFPFFLIGIFITNYSFNLLSQPLNQKLNNFKLRGMSKKLLLTLLLTESVIILFISTLASLIISYFVAYIGLQTNGYLSISIGNFPNIRFNSLIFTFLTLYLFLIFLLNSVPKIISGSKIESQNEVIFSENRDPFWKRHNFDFLAILIPLLLIIGYFIITSIIGPEILSPYYNLVIFLPFILVIGLFMATGRFLLYAIEKMTGTIKKSFRVNLKMGINLLNGINKTFLRGFIIITILMFMTNFFAIYTVSLQSDMLFKQYSDQGFDLEAKTGFFNTQTSESSYNQTVYSIYESNKENLSVPFEIRVYSFSENSYPALGLQNIRFFLMNVSQALSLFSKHIDSSKLVPSTISEKLIASTSEKSSKVSIIAQKTSLGNFGLINESSFSIGNVNFQIAGTFTNFPNVVPLSESGSTIDPMPVIIDNSNTNILNELVNESFLKEIQVLYGFNFKSESTEINTALSKAIADNFTSNGLTFNSIPIKINQFKNKASNIILFGELLLILFMTTIMILVVVILFIGNFFNQIRPIFLLEKSLGGSSGQIFTQSGFVIIFFILSSILTGILYTIIPFQLYYMISTINPFIVPVEFSVPYEALVSFYSLVILLSILIALIYNLKLRNLNLVEEPDVD